METGCRQVPAPTQVPIQWGPDADKFQRPPRLLSNGTSVQPGSSAHPGSYPMGTGCRPVLAPTQAPIQWVPVYRPALEATQVLVTNNSNSDSFSMYSGNSSSSSNSSSSTAYCSAFLSWQTYMQTYMNRKYQNHTGYPELSINYARKGKSQSAVKPEISC
jgi:hypothetical protein